MKTIDINGSKSHGPYSVISMVHHYLEVNADNRVGKNKDNFMRGGVDEPVIDWIQRQHQFASGGIEEPK